MLIRTGNHAAHLLMEVAIGLFGVLALAACTGAWRLAQGPIDITSLVRREQSLVTPPGVTVSIGGAALAWEGFVASDQPLDIRVADLRVSAADGSATLQVRKARLTISIGQMLIGRLVPRSLLVDGATVDMRRAEGSRLLGLGQSRDATRSGNAAARDMLAELAKPAPLGESIGKNLPWLSQLHRADLHNARVTVRDAAIGVVWQAPSVDLHVERLSGGGLSGQAHADLAVGDVRATIAARAELRQDGTHITATTSQLSPAALASATPAWAALAAIDLPLQASLDMALGTTLELRAARLTVTSGAGKVVAGGSTTGVQSADIVVLAEPSELSLQSATIALAALPGKQSPPVLHAAATATRLAGRVHATFSFSVPAMEMADLGDYWPPLVGRASRGWLVQNIVSGHARDAHVAGALNTPADFSDLRLTALTGSMSGDDVSVVWLRPIPPLTHGRAHLTIEGTDSMRITMDTADQDRLRVLPGSSMEITGLAHKNQLGDIEIRLAGPLDNALALLNHPRLKLLTRSGLDFTGAAGEARARMQVHMPLEDKVTMDDIRISATSTLTGVHLGKVAANRDLDDALLALKVDNDGLALTGHGTYAGIPTDLTLDMDFTDGGPGQVLQHVTAHGTATSAQIAAAGLPAAVAKTFSGGTTGLGVDYAALRDRTASLNLTADLKNAALTTPFGWQKAQGPDASATARLTWQNGQLIGVDHLHAEGPGLLIASHARIESEQAHALVLDQLDLGQTRAQGEIGFPATPAGRLTVTLAGQMLDLSGYLKEPQAERANNVPDDREEPPAQSEKRGQPWSADLRFAQVTLAKGKILAPFSLIAASDGLHISHADLRAGAPGELTARIIPGIDKRTVAVTASDAGVFLRAVGVADNLVGGHLQLDGVFADSLPGDPLTGTATLENFELRQAPALGRLLQAMTLYGLSDVLRGPGLHFSHLVAPFRWQRRVLTLKSARAFSPSLGLTAEGDIDLARRTADVKGTVVPAYFFNQLLGDLPVVGRIFSPEKGGGLFAARYAVTGKLADPKVGVNPLSALTPGFLREGFGLLSIKQGSAATAPH